MSQSPLPHDARTRAADLFEHYALRITTRLLRVYRSADEQLRYDAVVQAILHVCLHPERYDPERGSILSFLTGIARRMLLARMRSETRCRNREQEKAARDVTRKTSADKPLLEALLDQEEAARASAVLARTEKERRALDLWLHGETDWRVLADAVGLAKASEQEQETAVRRLLGRFRQRLHRYRQEQG
jgi:DNA-directed RNA polymerase specialized sigma24 family protein